jgi:hypothetical protein
LPRRILIVAGLIAALQYFPEVQYTSPFSSLEALAGESLQTKEKAEKSIFIYGTTFKKHESGRDFQRGQIWNNCSQKKLRQSTSRVSQLCRNAGCVHVDLLFFPFFFWRELSTRMSDISLTFCVPDEM